MEAATLVRRNRQRAGLSQSGLARRIGKTQATIAALERPGANPTIETLEEVLQALGYRLDLRAVRDRGEVDETLIARNLRMSPAERLAAFQTMHDELAELRGLMPDDHGG